MSALPLAGRVALITGVSRRIGIGAALVRRLRRDGASILATGWPRHDEEMPWGADPGRESALLEHLGGEAADLHYVIDDLEDPAAPQRLVENAVARFGRIDVLVANQARSSHQSLQALTVDELDRCWAANARASVLLAKALAGARPAGPGGRLVLFTSGQHIAPMADELPYSITKGAIHQMTRSLADALIDRGITVNCINPGPVDTGYATGRDHERVAKSFPGGRWGQPNDVARLVAWIASDESDWITGQIFDSEGGFRRWPSADPGTA